MTADIQHILKVNFISNACHVLVSKSRFLCLISLMSQNSWWEMWMAFIGSPSKEPSSIHSQHSDHLTSLFMEKIRSHQTVILYPLKHSAHITVSIFTESALFPSIFNEELLLLWKASHSPLHPIPAKILGSFSFTISAGFLQ